METPKGGTAQRRLVYNNYIIILLLIHNSFMSSNVLSIYFIFLHVHSINTVLASFDLVCRFVK